MARVALETERVTMNDERKGAISGSLFWLLDDFSGAAKSRTK